MRNANTHLILMTAAAAICPLSIVIRGPDNPRIRKSCKILVHENASPKIGKKSASVPAAKYNRPVLSEIMAQQTANVSDNNRLLP